MIEIPTDRGTHFTGHMPQVILRLFDIEHLMTISYHAQADEAAERALKTFVNDFSHYTSTDQSYWDQLINFAVFAINTSKSGTTDYSSFEIVFERPPVFTVNHAIGFDGFEERKNVSKY